MGLIDFEYCGKRLSDFGYMLCNIINDSGASSSNFGSNIVINTITNKRNSTSKITSVEHGEPYEKTFEICKICRSDDDYFTDEEIRKLSFWLNRPTFEKFCPIYDDGQYYDVHYFATFDTIKAIEFGGRIIGVELHLVTNASHGFGNDIEYEAVITDDDNSFSIISDSDEIGLLSANLTLYCQTNGDFSVDNSHNKIRITIKNCQLGEVITIDGTNKTIFSSKSHPTLANDFNYVFPAIVTDWDNQENVFTVNLPCELRLKYSPIRKVGIV